jgi:hypothetical protein
MGEAVAGRIRKYDVHRRSRHLRKPRWNQDWEKNFSTITGTGPEQSRQSPKEDRVDPWDLI